LPASSQETLLTSEPAPPGSADATLIESNAGAGEYVIQKGDSAAKMAQQFGITVSGLLEANPGLDPRRLKVGQRILIPKNE
jgi:LysM repeat protein